MSSTSDPDTPPEDNGPGDRLGPLGDGSSADRPRETPTEIPVETEFTHGRPLGRRVFLGAVGLGLTSLVWGQSALDLFSKSTTVLPQGLRSAIPFGQGWRIYAVNPPFPTFDRASWTFTIEGLVEKPVTYTYDDLLALPAADQTSDFHCVTGWSVDDVIWKGVRLDDLLAEAKPLSTAKGLEFWSMEEEYVDTLTLDQAAMPDVMLAYEMYGRPIPREHGAPTRVVIPKMYGYKGTKWCNRIKVVDTVEDGYWEVRGYDRDGWVGDSNGL